MEHNMTSGSSAKALVRFSIPFMLSSLLHLLYGIVDIMIVGRFSTAAAITAVNTSGQVMLTAASIVIGVASGATVLIGQYTGAGKKSSIGRAASSGFRVVGITTIVIFALLWIGTPTIVDLLQTPPEAVSEGKSYLYICTLGLPFIAAFNAIAAILRGLGNSKTPMYFIVAATVTNMIADFVLVGIFGLSATGAAIATAGAQALSAVLAVIYYIRHHKEYTGKGEVEPAPPAGEGGIILKIGAPMAAQEALVNISFAIITAVVNAMGVSQGAAVGVVERIIAFFMVVPIGFSNGIATFAAQNIGAKQPERALTGLKIAISLCLASSLIFFLLSQFAGAPLISLFTADKEVVSHGVLYLHTYGIDILFVCIVFCMNGFFSGCGHSGFSMLNSIISTFAVRVPLVFFFSMLPSTSLLLIGISAPTASFIQIIMQLIYLKTGRWKNAILDK